MSDTPETDAIDSLPYATYAQSHISKAYRDKARELERRLIAAEAENAVLREDAERYRWLRDTARFHADYPAHLKVIAFPGVVRWETMDAAIDAARKS